MARLQEEYNHLVKEKEKLYGEYGKIKKQVKEYDVIKQNIDNILNREETNKKERGVNMTQ